MPLIPGEKGKSLRTDLMGINGGILNPTDHYILPGITRMHLVQICKDNGIPVDETPFTMEELMDADEVIVSSSTKFCAPACEMNGTPIGGKAPELVKILQEKYLEKFENETK